MYGAEDLVWKDRESRIFVWLPGGLISLMMWGGGMLSLVHGSLRAKLGFSCLCHHCLLLGLREEE